MSSARPASRPGDRVVVVGAGLGGLAAALRLAAAGRDVEVLEAGAVPGGRCGILEVDGFAIDTGPAVLTLPHLIEELFAATGARMADSLTLERLDPAYQARFADGSTIAVRAGTEAMADEIAAVWGPAEAEGYRHLVAWLTRLYAAEWPHFIDRNFANLADYVRPRVLARVVGLRGLGRLHPTVSRFVTDDRLRRLFTFQALYAGLSPFDALAIYGVIAYMDTVAGVWFPRGGMHALPRALATRAAEIGVKIRYEARVERVLAGADGVTGVRLTSGETVTADWVVMNADLPVAYRDLIPLPPPRRLNRMRPSPSAWLFVAGVRGAVPVDAHHTIHFGRDYRGAFDDLVTRRRPMRDPSVLVSVPTHTDPALAPAGDSIVYYLVPAPALPCAVDWAAFADRHLEHLAALGYDIDGRIAVHRVTTPLDWEAQGMHRGTPFSLAHHFFQTGWFRPGNVDARLPGLVFTGSGTVPGVGVPMVLVSGRLAAERVLGGLGGGARSRRRKPPQARHGAPAWRAGPQSGEA